MKNRFTPLHHALLAAALITAAGLSAQAQSVGIGTTAPDASAALDIVSSNKGALLPRVASTGSVSSPATGLIVFQTGAPAGYYYNAGTPGAPSWQQLATAAGTTLTAGNGLTKTGQNLTLGGTLEAATTIAQGGNAFSLTGGNVGIGTGSPGATLDVNGSFNVGSNTLAAASITQLVQNNSLSSGGGTVGQSFTLPTAGTITSFALKYTAPTTATVTFYRGVNNTGVVVGTSQAVTFAAENLQTVTLATPLVLPAGVYTLVPSVLAVRSATGNPYAGGQVSFGTNMTSFVDHDFVFAINYTTGSSGTALAAIGGNVGIGTATPTKTLHVAGTAGTPNVLLEGLGGSGTRFVTTDASGNLGSTAVLGGADFIQNGIAEQPTSNFNVSGNGIIGGNSTVRGSSTLTGLLAANGGATINGPIFLNGSGTEPTFIGVGTTAGTVSIGRAGAPVRLPGFTTAGIVTNDASGNLSTASTASFGTSFIQNQTASAQAGGFRVSGNGTIGGSAVATTLQAVGAGAIGTQGAALQWNRSGGDGETWLLNQKGLSSNGLDGIRFGSATTANVVTEYARFIGNGNFGIGTVAPAQKLDVVGSAQASENLVVNGANTNAGNVASTLRFGAINSGEAIGSKRTASGNQFGLDFYTTSTARLSITSGGNVGIGTTAPLSGLHVDAPEVGNSTAVGVLMGGGTTGNPNIELRGSGKTPYIDFAENTGIDYSTRLISQTGTLNVQTGVANVPALSVNGYTRQVGANSAAAPAIATAKIAATMPTGASSQTVVALPAGIVGTKVLSLTAMVYDGATPPSAYPPNNGMPNVGGVGVAYQVYLFNNQIIINTNAGTTSNGVFGKAINVLITYEQ